RTSCFNAALQSAHTTTVVLCPDSLRRCSHHAHSVRDHRPLVRAFISLDASTDAVVRSVSRIAVHAAGVFRRPQSFVRCRAPSNGPVNSRSLSTLQESSSDLRPLFVVVTQAAGPSTVVRSFCVPACCGECTRSVWICEALWLQVSAAATTHAIDCSPGSTLLSFVSLAAIGQRIRPSPQVQVARRAATTSAPVPVLA
ncbi:hypothetical protein GN958_ATG03363, partial [Phytophthora infestans]